MTSQPSSDKLIRRALGEQPQDITRRAGLRLATFVFMVALGYLVVRQITLFVFVPRLMPVETLLPEIPDEGRPSREPQTAGVRVRNQWISPGYVFVVAVLADGSERTGPVVRVPPRDTATATVDLLFEAGDHVVSLLVFDVWRDIRRLGSFSGLLLKVGRSEITLRGRLFPDTVEVGDSLWAQVTLVNSGEREEVAVPLAVFVPEEGGLPLEAYVQMEVPLLPGEAETVSFRLYPQWVEPGLYEGVLMALSADGRRLGRARQRWPIVVTASSPDDERELVEQRRSPIRPSISANLSGAH